MMPSKVRSILTRYGLNEEAYRNEARKVRETHWELPYVCWIYCQVAACVYNEQRMTFSKCSAWSNCRIVSHQRSNCGCWSGRQRCVKAGEMLDTYEQARRKKGGPVKQRQVVKS